MAASTIGVAQSPLVCFQRSHRLEAFACLAGQSQSLRDNHFTTNKVLLVTPQGTSNCIKHQCYLPSPSFSQLLGYRSTFDIVKQIRERPFPADARLPTRSPSLMPAATQLGIENLGKTNLAARAESTRSWKANKAPMHGPCAMSEAENTKPVPDDVPCPILAAVMAESPLCRTFTGILR